MKSPGFLLLFAALLLAAPLLPAQEEYGIIRSTTKIRPDGTRSVTTIDPDKHTAEELLLDAGKTPKVLKKTVYQLGERDLAIGADFYDPKGNIAYRAAYQRDGAGRVAEAAFSTPDGVYLGKRVFVYSNGNIATQVIDYDANGQVIVHAQPVGKPKKSH